jgi:hypothetical protein
MRLREPAQARGERVGPVLDAPIPVVALPRVNLLPAPRSGCAPADGHLDAAEETDALKAVQENAQIEVRDPNSATAMRASPW